MATRTYDQNTLLHGDWNAICDVCGFKFKALDLKRRWDGYYVCEEDWERRHPADFFRAPKDDQSISWTRVDEFSNSSYTDVGGNMNTSENYPDTHGDASATITYGTNNDIHDWNTTLTAPRTCAIADGTAVASNRFTIYKTATGNTLDIDNSDTTLIRQIPAAVEAFIVVEFNGSTWFEVSYTTIGL